MSDFKSLNLNATILKSLLDEGYENPTPIQAQAIPIALEGKDLLACAQTGTGKTAAFVLPILERLAPNPGHEIRALVLTPTRELASQVADSFTKYGRGLGIKHSVIYGGVAQHRQVASLRRGVQVVVATPGRLLDLMQQDKVWLDHLEVLVLDEADRMLDMGFINDVRKMITAMPEDRQTLFFSATMSPEIIKLSRQILNNPVKVEIAATTATADKITQTLFHVPENKKTALLIHLLDDPSAQLSIVFTRTKRDANRVSESLMEAGIGAVAIHGNKTQAAREKALQGMKNGKWRVLVATDVAARGIDINNITHVFNYDIPDAAESYVHRIGRTARAGNSGMSISLCAPNERRYLNNIERFIRMHLTPMETPEGLQVEVRNRAREEQSYGQDQFRGSGSYENKRRPRSRY